MPTITIFELHKIRKALGDAVNQCQFEIDTPSREEHDRDVLVNEAHEHRQAAMEALDLVSGLLSEASKEAAPPITIAISHSVSGGVHQGLSIQCAQEIKVEEAFYDEDADFASYEYYRLVHLGAVEDPRKMLMHEYGIGEDSFNDE